MKNTPLNTTAVQRPGAFFGHITQTVRTWAASRYKPGGRTLDVGCGNGLFFASLTSASDQRIGIDLDIGLLQEARRIFADNRTSNVALCCGNVMHLPFPDKTFDNIFFLNTLVNIPTDEITSQLLRELMRICRPGGRLILDIRNAANPLLRLRYWRHNRRENFTTRGHHIRHLRGLFASQGFHVAHKIPIGPRLPCLAFGYVLDVRAPG